MDLQINGMFQPALDLPALARALDGMGEIQRVAAVTSLRRKQLAALFEAASPKLRLVDLVPADVPPLTEVIHEGKNSLPLFTRFQKRCYRPPNNQTELWGYNEQPNKTVTGPGYFVAHHTESGDLVIDYTRLPTDKLPEWPRILPNSARLSRFIYNGTVDVLRRVSDRVTIGRAYRNGKPMDAWFALVRRDVELAKRAH
jgi:hypothetical protein